MSHECGGAAVFEDVDRMIRQAWPDRVIVTTVDGYCHDRIIRRLEAGCDAIGEKPVTIDERECEAILVAE